MRGLLAYPLVLDIKIVYISSKIGRSPIDTVFDGAPVQARVKPVVPVIGPVAWAVALHVPTVPAGIVREKTPEGDEVIEQDVPAPMPTTFHVSAPGVPERTRD